MLKVSISKVIGLYQRALKAYVEENYNYNFR